MAANPDVLKLQQQLVELGFTLVGKPDGVAGTRTSFAIREFQYYARLSRVAKLKEPPQASDRYIDGLMAEANGHRLPDGYKPNNARDAKGLPDQTTRTCIDAWISAKYRCPLVIEGRKKAKKAEEPKTIPSFGNLWTYDDPVVTDFLRNNKLKPANLEFRVADFSADEPQTDWFDMPIVGSMSVLGPYRGGVSLDTAQLDPDLEYLPKVVTGKEWAELDAVNKSVFKIVRAAAEQECVGFFDCLNAWDRSVMSIGPCHWTLSLGFRSPPPRKTRLMPDGELSPFLAFAIGRHPEIQSTYLDPLGIRIAGEWPDGQPGNAFKGSWRSTRNFMGHLLWTKNHEGTAFEDATRYQDVQFFRTTHWFWRFLSMSRTSENLRRRQWDMVRMRLRDCLAKTLGGTGPYKNYQIGDLYTSELALALLLRSHIKGSGFTSAGRTAPTVGSALALAEMEGKPGDWVNADEARLIDGLLATGIRGTYELADILWPETEPAEPSRAQLITFGNEVEKKSDLHVGLDAIIKWPEAEVFRRRNYKLPQEIRTSLSKARDKDKKIFRALVDDRSLPPPPS